jgi:hypothetical protein
LTIGDSCGKILMTRRKYMKIIITGGGGLIGRALAADFAADGHEVFVLSRSPGKLKNLPKGVKAVDWDGKTAQGWGHLADGADAIVNLAAENLANENLLKIRWTAKRKTAIRESRVNAGAAVVEAVRAAARKPKVVLQASGVGYYGIHDEKPFDETAPAGNDFVAGICKVWEASTQSVEDMGVRWIVTRSGVVLSREGGSLPLQMLPFHLFVGGPIGSGKQGYSWVHILDEVKAMRFLIEYPDARGVFNLTSPVLVNNAQFGKTLGKVMKRPYYFPVPAFAFRLAFGDAATILVDGQLPEPKRLLELGYKFKFGDPEAALRDLLQN